MRPRRSTEAHSTGRLAELVCSNSFKSDRLPSAPAILKAELRRFGSLVLDVGDRSAVPAGSALAVDRDLFARGITARIEKEPLIEVVRDEASRLPDSGETIVATGPLTSAPLAETLGSITGAGRLYFYDAISPVVSDDSISSPPLFAASRYGKGGAGDYLNVPLDEKTYLRFVDSILAAELYPVHEFEESLFFDGCLPIEEIARRGRNTLAFGPMKPVGLIDPRTGKMPHAVIQLRRENREGTAWNLVGCQSRMRRGEQERIFRTLPGLEKAEFLRYGSLHRNTYLCSPALLEDDLTLKQAPHIRIAGQITGVEGYLESTTVGLVAGIAASRRLAGLPPLRWPDETAVGALLRHLRESDAATFQPTNIHFGLFPRLSGKKRRKRERNEAIHARAAARLESFLSETAARR